MEWCFDNIYDIFKNENNKKELLNGKWGLEKESLRVNKKGELVLTPHSPEFGDKLTNPNVTVDFSESQLELITKPFGSIEEAYADLKRIHQEVESKLNNEYLWPFSMPCSLPTEDKIPIAKFNNSKQGIESETYREGLAIRYGKKMQMISGIHYNFSFSGGFWEILYDKLGKEKTMQEFINDSYFSIARNVLRYRWILTYLFGASPTVDKSYEENVLKELEAIKICCACYADASTYHYDYATSLRVSRYGYSNMYQRCLDISYNSLDRYVAGLKTAMRTKSNDFEKLGTEKNGKKTQLNCNLLQKESEYYSPIRFKRVIKYGENQLDEILNKGIEYLEIRTLDINPFSEIGLSIDQLYFFHIFMLFTIFEENKHFSFEEHEEANNNHQLAALLGRQEGLLLVKEGEKITLQKWGEELFIKFAKIAKLLDEVTGDTIYYDVVRREKEKLKDISLLPSERILNEMKEKRMGFVNYGANLVQCVLNN